MVYGALAKQIEELPLEAQEEIAHYVGYLFSIYKPEEKKESVSEKINAFMKDNPNAFEEFKLVQSAGVKAIRELTKNDSW